MNSNPKCDHCPLHNSPHPCLGQAAPVLCARAGANEGFARALANNVKVESRPRTTQTSLPASWTPSPGKLRVGLACPALWLGGAESWQLNLARSVDAARIELMGCVVAEGPQNAVPSLVDAFAALMPVGFGPAQVAELATRCDVLVTWAIGGLGEILAGLPRERRPRIVAVSHSPAESPWAMKVYRNPTGIDRFVAVSELALPPIPESHRAAAAVIRNAVDPARLVPSRSREEMRAAWGVPIEARVLGYLGRLSSEKDPGAMARTVPHLPGDTHAVIVGDGLGAEQVRAFRHPRFHAVGGDPDAGSVLAAFDALVVPSDYESFGLTIAEGLWIGVPVISTPVGIAKLTPGLTRPIPIRASGQELAEAVRADREDADGTRARVDRAQAWARANLDPGRFGREWTDYLCGLAPERKPAIATRHAIADLRLLVLGCDYRGPVVVDGCSCLRTCWLGKGTGHGGAPGSLVGLNDCYACVSGSPG